MVFGLKKKSQGATANTAVDDNEVPVQGAPSTKSALIRVAATGAGLVRAPPPGGFSRVSSHDGRLTI